MVGALIDIVKLASAEVQRIDASNPANGGGESRQKTLRRWAPCCCGWGFFLDAGTFCAPLFRALAEQEGYRGDWGASQWMQATIAGAGPSGPHFKHHLEGPKGYASATRFEAGLRRAIVQAKFDLSPLWHRGIEEFAKRSFKEADWQLLLGMRDTIAALQGRWPEASSALGSALERHRDEVLEMLDIHEISSWNLSVLSLRANQGPGKQDFMASQTDAFLSLGNPWISRHGTQASPIPRAMSWSARLAGINSDAWVQSFAPRLRLHLSYTQTPSFIQSLPSYKKQGAALSLVDQALLGHERGILMAASQGAPKRTEPKKHALIRARAF